MSTPSDLNRLMTTLGHQRPDSAPIALSLALQAGRTTGIALPEILTDAGAFADAQLAMHERWQHEVAISMMYAAAEAEAFGSAVRFYDDGPPNAGAPIVNAPHDLDALPEPDPTSSAPLARTLEVIDRMQRGLDGRALTAAVAVGPLSGPVMWCGMEQWLRILLEEPEFAERIVARYRRFAHGWAQAQLAAGAQALIWFEPLASTSMLPLGLVERHAAEPLADACGLGAPVNLHLASARALDTVPLAASCGVTLLSIGLDDDPVELRAATAGSLSLIGTLNGLAMHRWDDDDAVRATREGIDRYGATGGYVVCDAHGEIPWQTPPEVLDHVTRARHDAQSEVTPLPG